MASEFKIKNGLIVVGDVSTSGTITINGALAATQSWVSSQAYLTSSSLTSYATQSYVTSAIASLVDSAPGALDTLRELATALGNDASFSTTVTNSIAAKLPLAGGTLTGALTGTSATFSGNVTLGNNSDLVFQDLAGTFPTTGKGFDWTLNNDGARIYAIQPNSDSIDFVFQLRDNATTNDRFVFWVDEWQGPAYDKYPLIISGGTEFDLKDSALYTNTVLRLSNSGVLQNVTGNISMFTNNAGYLTSYSETDTLQSVTNRGATTTNRVEFQYSVDRYSQAWKNTSTGAYWWVTTDSDKLGFHRNADGDKFYFSNTGDFYSTTNGWLSTALAAKQNASTAINTSNIASQSVSYATSAGSAGYVNNQSGQLASYDNRTISPSETNASYLQFGFTSWGNNNSAPYADYLHLRSYPDSSGGSDNLVMFLKSGIGMRIYQQTFGSASAYSSYADVWHSGNLTNLNQLTNGPGYITSYTEVDTLATVTGRGASTSTAVTFSGGATISGTGGDGSEVLRLTGSASDGFNYSTASVWGNLTAGETVAHVIGKAESQYNTANFGYRHVADGSPSNHVTIGMFQADNLFNILGNGNVGIGTTSPSFKLHVEGDSYVNGVLRISNANPLYFNDYGGGWYMADSTWVRTYNGKSVWVGGGLLGGDGGLTIGYGGTGSPSGGAIIAGNVGIGTTAPAQKLDVNGNISLGSWIKSGSTYVGLRREDDGSFGGGGDSGLVIESYNHASPYAGNYSQRVHLRTHLYNGGSNNVLTAYGTNVGIGTSTPGYKLETIGNARISGNLSIGTTYNGFAANIEGTVYVIGASVWVNDGYGYANASSSTGMYPDSSHNISFKSNNSTKVYINAAGNVGIGTTSPGADGLTIRREGSDKRTLLQLDRPNTPGLQTNIRFTVSDIMVGQIQHEYVASNYNHMSFTLRSPGGSDIIPLWLENSGNVGIGTTSPSKLLEVAGDIMAGTSNKIGFRYSGGDSNFYNYITANNANPLTLVGGMWTASGPTEGIRFSTYNGAAVSILNNGKVGIGTTAPAEKLHVLGAAIFDGGSGNSSTDAVVYITKSTSDDWGLYVNNTGLDYGTYTRVSPSANYALAIHNGTTWTTRITGNAIIYLGEKNAIEGNYDSWLRLNNSSQYASGVYTPGVMRADGGFNVSGSTVWHAGNDGSGSGLDADLLDGQNSTEFLRLLSGGAEASLDSYTDNGIRVVNFTGHSQHLLSWNAGGSTGTVQQLFYYGTPNNGWRIRNKTDNSSWSDWGYVVMASSNQGLISGTIATQSWVGSQSYATTSYVTTQINNLINGAPGVLDTLDELAAALGDDSNFATTVTNSIAGKVSKTGDTITGKITFPPAVANRPQFPGGMLGLDVGDGNFDIWGISRDYYPSHPTPSSAYGLRWNGDNNDFEFVGAGANRVVLDMDAGNLTIAGFLTESSSLKLKENVETSEGNLEKVVNLRPVTYNKIGSQTKELGLIAEEVATVYPEFVQYDESGEPVGVNYSRLTAALIGAVKELTQRIETLENNG